MLDPVNKIESTLLKTIFNPKCCNITPLYFSHFLADEKVCGCCVNLGKPIIGVARDVFSRIPNPRFFFQKNCLAFFIGAVKCGGFYVKINSFSNIFDLNRKILPRFKKNKNNLVR